MVLTKVALSFRITVETFATKIITRQSSMAEAELASFDKTPTWWSTKVAPYLSWKRTSLAILAFAEQKLFSGLKQPLESRYVPICNGQKRIWTVSLNTKSTNTPLVMLHGMGSGVGLWVLNLDSLSKNRPVYALDLLGFGRSSRTKFSSDPTVAEQEFVDSIEEWRKAMNLEKIILLGHSLGGYLSACYSMSYPQHIKHLILVDPWGLPEQPVDFDMRRELPMFVRVIATVIAPFNPFAPLRAAGPWGPSLVARLRSDLIRKYERLYTDNRIADYIYHCNAQYPSGEVAFKTMMHQFGWAKFPIMPRINNIAPELSMTLIHGSRSWVDYSVAYQVQYQRPNSLVDVKVIKGAGHHVYADIPEEFNEMVNRTCDLADRPISHSKWSGSPLLIRHGKVLEAEIPETPIRSQSMQNRTSGSVKEKEKLGNSHSKASINLSANAHVD